MSVFGSMEQQDPPTGEGDNSGLILPAIDPPVPPDGNNGNGSGVQGGTNGSPEAHDRRELFRAVQAFYKSSADKFHGRDDEDVTEFIETFESLFSVTGAPIALAASMFQFVIDDAARDFFRMLPRAKKENWARLKESFTHQYASAARRQRLAQRYQTLKQQTFYGLDAYYKELVDVARQLPESYRMPDMLRDKFVSGLHPALREAVTLVDPLDLQAAYDRAKLALQSRRFTVEPSRRARIRAPWRSSGKGERSTVGALVEEESKEHKTNRVQTRKKMQCWHCGEEGHMKRECPRLARARSVESVQENE